MLKRYLGDTEPSPANLDLGTFQSLIRLGNERGLLRSDWGLWKTYHQARTNSSPTYDAAKAEAVFGLAHPRGPGGLASTGETFRQIIQKDKAVVQHAQA